MVTWILLYVTIRSQHLMGTVLHNAYLSQVRSSLSPLEVERSCKVRQTDSRGSIHLLLCGTFLVYGWCVPPTKGRLLKEKSQTERRDRGGRNPLWLRDEMSCCWKGIRSLKEKMNEFAKMLLFCNTLLCSLVLCYKMKQSLMEQQGFPKFCHWQTHFAEHVIPQLD